jgi:hypothetical protein
MVKRMKKEEKLEFLQKHYLGDWLKTRSVVDGEMSKKQSLLCVCGKLATGLHESSCRKFIDIVNRETIKRLKHLFPRERRMT